jgi:LysR family cys regulon transcriptional activator
MNFQQLKIIRESARCNYNLTEVANTLFTSQSGVSRHIRELEEELGIEIFIRRGKRLLGMTEPGKELLVVAERILNDANNIRRLADVFSSNDSGQLHIATTHTQARYSLPGVIKEFRALYPRVRVVLNQGSPEEIVSMLAAGEADIGIASERLMSAGRARVDASAAGDAGDAQHFAADHLPAEHYRAREAGCGVQSGGPDPGHRAQRTRLRRD